MTNFCIESGCMSSCCRNVLLLVTAEERKIFFSDIILEAKHRDDFIEIAIIGWCPNLDTLSGNCKIYDQRPQVCRNLVLHGALCHELRSRFDHNSRK